MTDGRASAKLWSEAEDTRLAAICGARPAKGGVWDEVAQQFPGRSAVACRQRWLALRQKAQGIVKPQKQRERKANGRICRIAADAEALAAIAAAPVLRHASLTAAVFGDPLPGRSALDMRGRQ
jgi:hypothetical protein